MGHYEHQRRQDTPELGYGKGEREGPRHRQAKTAAALLKCRFA